MGDVRLYEFIYERVGDMRRKLAVLCIATAMAIAATGCGGKEKEEAKPAATAEPTQETAKETEAPKETVSADASASDNQDDSVSGQETAKKAKKKKKKAKETAAAEENSSPEDIAAARARAQAEEEAQRQAAEQARIAAEEAQRIADEEEARRIAEEEAQRIAQEQAAQNIPQDEITDQDIPQDTSITSEEAKAIAQSYVGATLDELMGAIGAPVREAGRMPSCQGDGTGEDVAYEYDGFTVMTYEKDGVRTVTGVE